MINKIKANQFGEIEDFCKSIFEGWAKAIKGYENPLIETLGNGCPMFFLAPTYSYIYARSNNEGQFYLKLKDFLKTNKTDIKDEEAIIAYFRASHITSIHHSRLSDIVTIIENIINKETFADFFEFIANDFNFCFIPFFYGVSFGNITKSYVNGLIKTDLESNLLNIKDYKLNDLSTKTKTGEFFNFLNRIGFITQVLDKYLKNNPEKEFELDDAQDLIDNFIYMFNKKFQLIGNAKKYFEKRYDGIYFLDDPKTVNDIYLDLIAGVDILVEEVYGN